MTPSLLPVSLIMMSSVRERRMQVNIGKIVMWLLIRKKNTVTRRDEMGMMMRLN